MQQARDLLANGPRPAEVAELLVLSRSRLSHLMRRGRESGLN